LIVARQSVSSPTLAPRLRGYSLSSPSTLSGPAWLFALPVVLLMRTQGAGGRQPIQPVKDTAHLPGHPKSMPPCCRNAACGESCGDGIRRSNAAGPDLGSHRSERGSARISFRNAGRTAGLASLRRCQRVHCYVHHQQTWQPDPTGNPSLTEGQGWGPGYRALSSGKCDESAGGNFSPEK